jgi:ABC-type thiamin/hydroxymethylpyrimidine transport system permease subunit
MKNNIIQLSIIASIISLIIGVIIRFTHKHVIFASYTWHQFAHTALLFAIAWGVWIYSTKNQEKK